jgi:hypothetical protein
MDYSIVLFRDPVDGDWIAAVPDLGSGVSAFGTLARKLCTRSRSSLRRFSMLCETHGDTPPEVRYRPEVERVSA